MTRSAHLPVSRFRGAVRGVLLAALAFGFLPGEARALITGGEGNEPIHDPGWPAGAAEVFNTKARIAWWEGPPFGGGEWHAECRGDAAALNEVFKAFATVDAPKKRIVLFDGVGRSFWLNPNGEEAKRAAAEVDWTFAVWQPDRWKQLRQLPADLRPGRDSSSDDVPPPTIEVFVGGRVRWEEVTVPEGIEVDDQRLEAHGFKAEDGPVLEGKVTDLATGKPLAARVRLEKVEPRKGGGYDYPEVVTTDADAAGRWVLKSVQPNWVRIVVGAEGYLPRVVGFHTFDGQPRWSELNTSLAKAATVSGRVSDDAGKPLADVEVQFANVVATNGERYETPEGEPIKTDAEGRFTADRIPVGKASVWLRKPGYVRPGLGLPIEMPAADVSLSMKKSAAITIRVDFGGHERSGGYLVEMKPEEGEAVGRWSGSGDVDAEGTLRWSEIPPGKYVLVGRPNPGSESEQTESVTVELRGGETTEVTVKAK